jgi:hypothetical protein
MSWYKTGSVSVVQNSNAVIGAGTAFIANGRVGDAFQGPDGDWYEVTNIASDAAMSIAPNYRGATTSAGFYALAPMQGYNKDTADALRAASLQVGDALDGLEESVTEASQSAAAALTYKNAAATSETNAGNSASAALISKNSAVTSEGHAADSAAAALASKNAAAASETNAGASAADALSSKNAAAVSETNAAASAATAANLGVGKGYIEGLQMSFQSARAMTVGPGVACLPSGTRIVVGADIVKTAITLTASGFTHVYLYLNAGVPDLEFSSAAPVKYNGTAYQKTGDASRRYLGSLLANSSSNMYRWRHDVAKNRITYTQAASTTAPFLLVTQWGATTYSPVSPAPVAPVQTATHLLTVTNVISLAYYFLPEQQSSPTAGNFMQVVGSQSNAVNNALISHEVELSREPGLTFSQFGVAVQGGVSGAQMSMFVYGYTYER